MMKTVINILQIFKLLKKAPWLLQITEGLFKFVESTNEIGKPMMQNIVLRDNKTNAKVGNFISMWACVGEANPITRCGELKSQVEELKRLLNRSIERELTDLEKQECKIIIDIFN